MTETQKERNETIMERYRGRGAINIGRIFVLADMAEHGERPDESFNDDERELWWLFSGMTAGTHG